jgi:hypothetical protein
MLSLKTVGKRFETSLKVIAGGSGTVSGIITETDQSQVPSYIFVPPRHIFRMTYPTALKVGQVVETPTKLRFIVGDNGPSEQTEGVLWQSFRLFQATHYLPWTRRSTVMDPTTHLEKDGPVIRQGDIWIAIEPTDREELDRRIRASAERARFIAGVDIKADDLIGDYEVIRADLQLGLQIGVLTY